MHVKKKQAYEPYELAISMSSILQPIFINCKIKGGKQPNTRQGFKQVNQKFPKEASTWGTSLTKAIVTSLLTSAFTWPLEPHVVHIRTSDNVPKPENSDSGCFSEKQTEPPFLKGP